MILETTLNGFKFIPHGHIGLDIPLKSGTEIHAPSNAIVQAVIDEGNKSLGESLILHCSDGKEIHFGHLSKVMVEQGQTINSGDTIALSGNSGNSANPHLFVQIHDGTSFVDPTLYLQAHPVLVMSWIDSVKNVFLEHVNNAIHVISHSI